MRRKSTEQVILDYKVRYRNRLKSEGVDVDTKESILKIYDYLISYLYITHRISNSCEEAEIFDKYFRDEYKEAK